MKLLASDLDGTFSIGTPDARRAAVKKWREAGNLFVIVSGRSLKWLTPEFKNLGIECDYYLAANGAVIADRAGKTLRTRRCPGEWIREIIDFLFQRNCLLCRLLLDEDKMVFPPDRLPDQPVISFAEAAELPFFYQISTVCPAAEDASQVVRELAAAFPGRINPLQNGVCIDIVPAGMDKAQGIRNLIELLELPEENVIAVGDNYNDLSMIDAFYSYAIESGVEEARSRADRLTPNIVELIERELSLQKT